jgi:fluoride ion exporter CrcB/FEX
VALAELLDLGRETQTFCPEPGVCFEEESDADASTYVAMSVAGGLLGIGTGAYLARKPITSGTAAAVTLGGMWGTWFGFGLSFLADQEGDELLLGTMMGGNAALVALGIVAPRWQMSESRARLISIGGVAGGLAGAGLLLIAQPDDENVAILMPLAGSAA